VATQRQNEFPFPLPTEVETAALETVSHYLTRAGTHAASYLLGCPTPDAATGMFADLSNNLLGSATLCQGMLELADNQRHR
jgi:hypothetical protein